MKQTPLDFVHEERISSSNYAKCRDHNPIYIRMGSFARTCGVPGIQYSPKNKKSCRETLRSPIDIHIPSFESNEVSAEELIFIISKAGKIYWVNEKIFFIDADEVLRNNPKNGRKPRLVMPKTLVGEVLD